MHAGGGRKAVAGQSAESLAHRLARSEMRVSGVRLALLSDVL